MCRTIVLLLLSVAFAGAQTTTELWLRGHPLIPAPRKVLLGEGRVRLDTAWSVDPGEVGSGHIAVRSLLHDLAGFHHLILPAKPAGHESIRLAVSPGAVETGAEPEVDKQAYRLWISDDGIEITGNHEQGLFYGVQTLLQLVKSDSDGHLILPKMTIQDWPSFQLRFLHWDTKHHQDRMETLKRYLDWAARFKINMIGFELEDKFSYPSHPVIGAPGAFTPAQLQEIVDYGLERFIQVVPVIQAPAHMAYVLKHPAFSGLRADGNNYQIDLCNPRAYQLIFSMYDDIVRATRGVDYFFVSTDEVYYAGAGKTCAAAYNPENRSLKWVEFVNRAHEFLSKRSRRVLVWAEYPLLPGHAKLLPPNIIDGIVGDLEYIKTENERGIRQLVYTSVQGAELLFPNYLSFQMPQRPARGRLESAWEASSSEKLRGSKPIGVFGASWDDAGLHNETFWLGWSAIAQSGWNPGATSVEQHISEFMNIYYGSRAVEMTEIYRSLQQQARVWERSWDRVTSRVRGPGYGNSEGKGRGTQRYDLTLSPPSLPQWPDKEYQAEFSSKYAKWIAEAPELSRANERLIQAIEENIGRADRNAYNLEVLLVLSRLIGHQWRLVTGLASAEKQLIQASSAMQNNKAEEAVKHMAAARGEITRLEKERVRVFHDLVTVFEKSTYPKRTALHVLDDTKDHWADRRADLSFMMVPEESMKLGAWVNRLEGMIREYAKAHGVKSE